MPASGASGIGTIAPSPESGRVELAVLDSDLGCSGEI